MKLESKAISKLPKDPPIGPLMKGASNMLVIFDYLVLVEAEYDEYDEFIQGDYIDEFVAEIK